MSKIIIENRSRLSDLEATLGVAEVIRSGRISNDDKQYCYATRFMNGTLIVADLNKCPDRFIVMDDQNES